MSMPIRSASHLRILSLMHLRRRLSKTSKSSLSAKIPISKIMKQWACHFQCLERPSAHPRWNKSTMRSKMTQLSTLECLNLFTETWPNGPSKESSFSTQYWPCVKVPRTLTRKKVGRTSHSKSYARFLAIQTEWSSCSGAKKPMRRRHWSIRLST